MIFLSLGVRAVDTGQMVITTTALALDYQGVPEFSSSHPEQLTDAAGNLLTGRVPVVVADPVPADLLRDWRFISVPDGYQFADYQAGMLATVELWTAATLATGFTFNGIVYPLDPDSRLQWLGLLTLPAALAYPLHVTSLDGRTVTNMDQPTATAAAQAAMAAYVSAGQKAAATRLRITSATTPAQLDAIPLPPA